MLFRSAPANPPARTLITPVVRVGTAAAEVRSSILNPGQTGTYQVSFVVPTGQTGRVTVRIEGSSSISNSIQLPVIP